MRIKTRRAILDTLKREGAQDSDSLARRFGLTPMAVRLQLERLSRDRLVSCKTVRRPRGRPAFLWRLTRKADAIFPDAHAELTVGLIDSARKAFGPSGFRRLLDARARGQAALYRKRLPPGSASPARKVAALARLRSREGYMAECRRARDGTLLLSENHCPICVAATACPGLCQAELAVFRKALGPQVSVERTEHILAGDRRCTYRIAVKRPAPDAS